MCCRDRKRERIGVIEAAATTLGSSTAEHEPAYPSGSPSAAIPHRKGRHTANRARRHMDTLLAEVAHHLAERSVLSADACHVARLSSSNQRICGFASLMACAVIAHSLPWVGRPLRTER